MYRHLFCVHCCNNVRIFLSSCKSFAFYLFFFFFGCHFHNNTDDDDDDLGVHFRMRFLVLAALVATALASPVIDFGLLSDEEIEYINKVQTSWKVTPEREQRRWSLWTFTITKKTPLAFPEYLSLTHTCIVNPRYHFTL